jgi:hypothetical protein
MGLNSICISVFIEPTDDLGANCRVEASAGVIKYAELPRVYFYESPGVRQPAS